MPNLFLSEVVVLERKYEILYIVRPDLEEGGHEGVTSEYQGFIEESLGSVIKVDDWGSKKFAHPVEKHENGNYILLTFNADSAKLDVLEGKLKLDDRVLRYQIVRLEEEKVAAPAPAAS